MAHRLYGILLALVLIAGAPAISSAVWAEEQSDRSNHATATGGMQRTVPTGQGGLSATGAGGSFRYEMHDLSARSVVSGDELLLFFVPSADGLSRKTQGILCSDLRVCGRRPCEPWGVSGCGRHPGGERDQERG